MLDQMRAGGEIHGAVVGEGFVEGAHLFEWGFHVIPSGAKRSEESLAIVRARGKGSLASLGMT